MSFSVNFIWSAWSVIRSFKIWIRFWSFAKENKLASNPGMCQEQPQGAGHPGLGVGDVCPPGLALQPGVGGEEPRGGLRK